MEEYPYNASKRAKLSRPTVKKMVECLSVLPQDARLFICDCPFGYIHVDDINNEINVDVDALYESYTEEDCAEYFYND